MHDLTESSDLSLLALQAQALIEDEADDIANLANLSALIYTSLPDLNWVGFYLYKEGHLILGPFQGKPACVHLYLNKGVCGTAAAQKRTLNVPDVHAFEGHVACDSASLSECVVPMIVEGNVIGVLDVDSPILNRFDPATQTFLEAVVDAYIKNRI
jgi:GAF domain-containing protein